MSEMDSTQVLRFALGEDDYCLPIDYVAEIVGAAEIQPLPNTDSHVEGITDLRGRTTTVVDPSKLLDVETDGLVTDGGRATNRIIVLDSDALDTESSTGWLVSAVNDVIEVGEKAVDDETTSDNDLLRGFLKDDDGFTLWLEPTEFVA